ncbi:MAG: nucleotide exchange factor GrpE [Eubacterium sp.]
MEDNNNSKETKEDIEFNVEADSVEEAENVDEVDVDENASDAEAADFSDEAGAVDADDEACGADADNADANDNPVSSKGKFKDKLKKKDKKDKKDQQIEELNDKYMRLMAEFDNFRNRTEKEKTAMYEVGAKSVIEKLLPVIDNFERGLDSIPEEEKSGAFAQGMEMTYKQLITMLESIDCKPIDAVGKQFDPNLHNAVMHVEDESLEENIVAQEFQKGYTYRGSVVRCSMVQVAN